MFHIHDNHASHVKRGEIIMNIKRKTLYLAIFITTLFFAINLSNGTVHAEDATVVIGLTPDGEVNYGDTVSATVIVSGDSVANYSLYLMYSPGLLECVSGEGVDGTISISGSGPATYNYTFKAVGEGRASISTSGTEVYDSEGNTLSIAHAGANITVGKVETEEGTIKIGSEVYTLVNEYHLPDPPEGYTLTSVNYEDREMFAYRAPNQQLKVVCLQNVEGKQIWFVFDEDTQTFSPFINYGLDGVKYIIINKPSDVELPENYSESSLSINDTQFTAYAVDSSGLFLVYAINVRGEAGFYYYDTDEGSLTRYEMVKSLMGEATASDADKKVENTSEQTTEVKYATPLIADEKKTTSEEDEGLVSRETLKRLLMMMIVLFVIMCIVVIILVIRNSILQNQLDDEEYGDEEEDSYKITPKENDLDDDLYNKAVSDARKFSRNKSYGVNEDTGEILLEEAEDNNSGVNVPPAEEKQVNKLEDALKERPYGIDSAFNVASPEENPQGEHVYVEKEKEGDVVNQEMVDKVRKEKKEKLEAEESAVQETSEQPENETAAYESETEELKQVEDSSEKSEDEEGTSSIFKKKRRNRKRNKKNKKEFKKEEISEVSEKKDISEEEKQGSKIANKVVLPGTDYEED